jgi:hypothetical protein
MGSERLPELGVVLGCIWEEVALEPGVTEVSVSAGLDGQTLRLRAEGAGVFSAEPERGWSSPLPGAVMGRLTRQSSLTRGEGRIVIEADFSIRS